MKKLTDILTMGEYGAFIWPAYGFAAIVMLGLLILSVRARRRAGKQLAHIEQMPTHES